MLNLSHLIVPGESLPEGWSRHYDSNQRIYYYYNELTQQSQWDKPNQPAIYSVPPSIQKMDKPSPSKSYYSDADDDNDDSIDFKSIDDKTSKHKKKNKKHKKDKKTTDKHKNQLSKDDKTSDNRNVASYSDYDSDNQSIYTIKQNFVSKSNSKVQKVVKLDTYSDMEDENDKIQSTTNLKDNEKYDKISMFDPSRDIVVGGNYKRQHGKNNQDYLYLAKLYRIHCHYSNPAKLLKCVLCQENTSTHTFFPCDHRCVCYDCIQQECIYEYSRVISDDIESSSDVKIHYNCPLCGNIIKKMYRSEENGEEREKYLQWCYEIVPPLDPKFVARFNRAAAALESVYVRRESTSNSSACIVS